MFSFQYRFHPTTEYPIWFQKNPKVIKPGDFRIIQFLQQESMTATKWASITDKEEYMQQLKHILSQLQSKEKLKASLQN